MNDFESIDRTRLEQDLHQALKLWHSAGMEGSPLDYLFLLEQAQEVDNLRQATNQILLKALESLATDYDEDARLLRMRFLDRMVMHAVANRLNVAEVTANKKQRQALRRLATVVIDMEQRARNDRLIILERRLNLPAQPHLFGIEAYGQQLRQLLLAEKDPWLISIEGLGGIGKTTLAAVMTREIALTRRFENIAWVSARQQDFLPHLGLQPAEPAPALNVDTLVDTLLDQLNPNAVRPPSPAEKLITLNRLLKKAPYLMVIDNLETAADYQALLPILRQLANPSKFLLTSRHSLKAAEDVSCITLKELNEEDTLAFLKHEAKLRGLPSLTEASEEQLVHIYQVVGGNPLALKLVLGQVWVLPLSQVLENLRQAQGKKADQLYTYIYWQAWQTLDPASRQVLLVMPLVQDGTMDQLAAISGLGAAGLSQALEQLAAFSLLEVGGDLEYRRYRIHRLTETFLLNEVVKWQSGGE